MPVPLDEAASPADGEKSRARVTRSVLRGATIILCGPLLVVMITQPAVRLRVLVALVTVTALGLIGLELNRRGRTSFASWLFIFGFIALSTVLSLRAGGVRSPGVQASMVFVLMAGLMLGKRAELQVAGVCVAIGLTLALAELNGILPAQSIHYGALTQWILNTAYLGFMFLLVRMTTSTIEGALRHASAELVERRAAESKLIESERTLQKLFDTAPTPIVIVRPPTGEIERANSAAFELLGLSPEAAIGRTTVAAGLVPDPRTSQVIEAELASSRRVKGQEMVIWRTGRDKRTVSVNADRIALDSGDRFIFSFYDLTELRRAEEGLRASVEETRQLYVRLANVEDDERRALHAELHDQVGANLSTVGLELHVAATLLSRQENATAQRHLNSAREAVTETIAKARNLMAGLRPPGLDDHGLVAALHTFAESQSPRLNLPIDVAGEDLSPRPSRHIEAALFRIAQEAVLNAARHASATRVAVAIGERDGRVTLCVEDDGVGFDLEAPGIGPDHWGLKSMRERARAIGGMLHVETAPGAGTRVTAEAPGEAV